MRRRWASVVAVGALALLGACGDDDFVEAPSVDEEIEAVDPDRQLYGDLFRDPGYFIGDEVVVSGEVIDVLSPSIFRLAGPLEGQSVLVVSAGPEQVIEDHVVKVTGRIDDLDVLFLERELGRDLDDEVLEPFEGEGVIVAVAVDD
ncbi:MAG: hypothetical protein M3N15_08175 [Actinomycetota bacterium]|nr:hypothetical protein [Actinomycetota bacterium]